jgi:hypothetical protein
MIADKLETIVRYYCEWVGYVYFLTKLDKQLPFNSFIVN